jgi:hypothetical protein
MRRHRYSTVTPHMVLQSIGVTMTDTILTTSIISSMFKRKIKDVFYHQIDDEDRHDYADECNGLHIIGKCADCERHAYYCIVEYDKPTTDDYFNAWYWCGNCYVG